MRRIIAECLLLICGSPAFSQGIQQENLLFFKEKSIDNMIKRLSPELYAQKYLLFLSKSEDIRTLLKHHTLWLDCDTQNGVFNTAVTIILLWMKKKPISTVFKYGYSTHGRNSLS